ncbi:unnamed protein product [Schistocephalus solidus]|uniref:Sulfate_transp domain-containing protein n=1 Tax=Schistocephalus solidus TaxID=70667 RepID=A0A183S7B3_SCHSO|nr:unnamed protein product [Schistocephalus solidus]
MERVASEHAAPSEASENVLRERRRFYTQLEFDRRYLQRLLEPPVTFRKKVDMVMRRAGRQLRRAYCREVPNHQNSGLPLARQSSSEASEDESERTGSSDKREPSRRRCSLIPSFLLGIFPFINIMRAYDLRSGLPNDIICGFTVGIMNIPQGMAYAMLATLPPVYGLYCSLFAPLFYFFFGTSRHLAMGFSSISVVPFLAERKPQLMAIPRSFIGTIAIVSLLVGGSLDRTIAALHTPNNTSDLLNNITKNSPTVEEETAIRVALGSALGMAVGLTQVCTQVFLILLPISPPDTVFTRELHRVGHHNV